MPAKGSNYGKEFIILRETKPSARGKKNVATLYVLSDVISNHRDVFYSIPSRLNLRILGEQSMTDIILRDMGLMLGLLVSHTSHGVTSTLSTFKRWRILCA